MKRTTFLKTLLAAVLLCVGGSNAWAEDVVETYDLESWGKSHMTRNTYATMGTTSAEFQVNSVDMNKLHITGSADAATWDLGNRFAVSSNVTFRWGSGGSDVPRLGNENQSGVRYISIIDLKAGDRVVITCSNLKFYSTNATYDDGGTPTSVTSDGTVTSGTTYTITGEGTQHLDFSIASRTWGSITKVVITRDVSCADPTYTITGASGTSRKFTLSCATDGATIYYSETEKAAGAAGWTEYSDEVTTSATTIWAYASKSGGNSSVISFSTGAGTTLTLNAPSLNLVDFTKSGSDYYPKYTFSSDQTSVVGNPSVTYTYTIGGTPSAGNVTEYAEAKAGTLIVSANAAGYNSATTEIVLYKYSQTIAYDFTDADFPLNSNWTLENADAAMKSGTYVDGEGNTIKGKRYQPADDRVNENGYLFDNVAFSYNDKSLYYYVSGLGLGYQGGSGHNTTTITVSGLTANSYTVYKKQLSGNPQSFSTSIVAGNNTFTMNKNSGTGAYVLQGIYVYNSADKDVVDAIADCKTYETSATFATAIDAESFASAAEVYAFNTTYHITNGVVTDGKRDITGVIRNAAVADATDWDGASILNGEKYTGAPDEYYLDKNTGSIDASQTIYNLPAGVYVLKAATRAKVGTSGTIYAWDGTNNHTTAINANGNTGGSLDKGWDWTELEFTLTSSANVKVGFWANVDGYWASCDDWHLYKVESVSKTISAAGWATYCSPYALDFSSSIANLTKAYIITGHSGATLTLSPIITTIPANTGILLEGGGAVSIPVAASSSTDVSANILKGVTSATVKTAKSIYVLMNEAAGVGFYKNNNDFTVGANTAYIDATDLAGARSFYLFEDDATAIEAVKAQNVENGQFFNLAGQRVAQPTKGLYIVNGKKVIIK